ncbi:hypothetical protein FMM75_23030 [Lachnospiraceae bacterium MD335]|nr:hypothetical protein [Lachnospiraceae bacterium MD335]
MGKTELTWDDFETYLPENFEFDEKQMEFYKMVFEVLIHNKDTSKVTCFGGRPGIGKSTLIKTFMHCCIGDYFYGRRHEPLGLVVITDSIKRLEELSNGRKDREEAAKCWGEIFESFGINDHYKEFEKSVIVLRSNTSVPFEKQLLDQYYKPIVLLSTQRYFMLSEQVRDQLFRFNHNNKPLKRSIVIFDECPYFSETVTINSKNLTDIESALYEGLSDEVENKKFAIREFKIFKDRLLSQMDEKEDSTKDNVTLYWKDERYPTITPNDTLFFEVVEKNRESLTQQYNAILKDLQYLREIAENGAIFNFIKKKKSDKYERSIILVRDNRESFYLGQDKKFFVFDATCDIDPRYDLDYVEIISGKKYNKPLKMTITNVKMTTSKNVLCNGRNQSFSTTNAITNYLKNKIHFGIGKQRKILIVTYSNLVQRFSKEFDYVGYFGNLKGFNDFKDFYKMAHIGMNRYPPTAYFYIYCGCNMNVYHELKDMTEDESKNFFKSINSNSSEYQSILDTIMLRCMLADFEQNIFRLAIRNYGNTDNVHIWTFYNNGSDVYSALSSMIEDRYKPYGTLFEYEDTPEELQIEKVKDRKPPEGKEKTNAQKVIEWYEKLPANEEFKIGKVLKDTQLTNNQLQNVRKKNSVVEKIFEKCKTERKGYYRKSS